MVIEVQGFLDVLSVMGAGTVQKTFVVTVEDGVETFEGKERGARSLEWVGWGASHHSGHVARLA